MSRDSHYAVPPIWPIRHGVLLPVDWSTAARSEEAAAIIEVLRAVDMGGVPLLVRGSLLEQLQPHPKADIDLVVVSDRPIYIDLGRLRPFGRALDVCRADPRAVDGALMTLARTRALQVGGRPFAAAPVRVSGELILAHWVHYSAAGLSPRIHSLDKWFVPRVKQLLRMAGLIRLLEHGEYSRDLHFCARWMGQMDRRWQEQAVDLLAAMAGGTGVWFDTTVLKRAMRERFYPLYRRAFGSAPNQ